MGNDNLLDIVADLTASIEIAQSYKTNVELERYFAENGFDGTELMEISNFIEANVTQEEFDEALESRTLANYLSGLKRMRDYIQMAKGYQDMNLEQNEEELWKNREVDSSEVDRENT